MTTKVTKVKEKLKEETKENKEIIKANIIDDEYLKNTFHNCIHCWYDTGNMTCLKIMTKITTDIKNKFTISHTLLEKVFEYFCYDKSGARWHRGNGRCLVVEDDTVRITTFIKFVIDNLTKEQLSNININTYNKVATYYQFIEIITYLKINDKDNFVNETYLNLIKVVYNIENDFYNNLNIIVAQNTSNLAIDNINLDDEIILNLFDIIIFNSKFKFELKLDARVVRYLELKDKEKDKEKNKEKNKEKLKEKLKDNFDNKLLEVCSTKLSHSRLIITYYYNKDSNLFTDELISNICNYNSSLDIEFIFKLTKTKPTKSNFEAIINHTHNSILDLNGNQEKLLTLFKLGYSVTHDDIIYSIKHSCVIPGLKAVLTKEDVQLCYDNDFYPEYNYCETIDKNMIELYKLCKKKNKANIEKLIKNKKLKPDNLCLELACRFTNNLATQNFLIEKGAPVTLKCLENAIGASKDVGVKMLLQKYVEINKLK